MRYDFVITRLRSAVRYAAILLIALLTAVDTVADEVGASTEAQNLVAAIPKIPTEITADSMDFDVEKRTAVFLGGVLVRDERFQLTAHKISVEFTDKDQLRKFEAEGDVRVTSGTNEATGGRAIYDATDESVTLLENPVLKQGLHQVVGAKKIIYMHATGTFKTVEGRPTITYYPEPTPKSVEHSVNRSDKSGE